MKRYTTTTNSENLKIVKEEIKKIQNLLNKYDPSGAYSAGMIEDEYSAEAEKIYQKITRIEGKDKRIENILTEVFTNSFGDDYDKSSLPTLAQEILAVSRL